MDALANLITGLPAGGAAIPLSAPLLALGASGAPLNAWNCLAAVAGGCLLLVGLR
jgi:hypothetical protein